MHLNILLESENLHTVTFSFFSASPTYQEAREEGKREGKREGKQEGRFEAKLEAVPKLLALGLTPEQIAQALDLDVAQVQQVSQQTPLNQ